MERRILRVVLALTLAASMLAATCQRTQAQAVTAVPKLDLTRFSGVWYEIERYPMKREKKCIGNAQMLFALGDKKNHIQLVNACKVKAGYTEATNVDGKAADKIGDGKLKLGSIWPFYRKYWVIALGPEYDWAVVGSPNHKDLWIYSRSATMQPSTLADARGQAAAQGFNISKLIVTPQGLE